MRVGGEALTPETAQRFTQTFPGTPLHNLYGPTEASVDVLGWTADGGPISLGTPGWNVHAYVLDDYLNPVPDGASGELYLAGIQLADGYLHRHALTAQRFIANPFHTGTRMYRTGDLVRWDPPRPDPPPWTTSAAPTNKSNSAAYASNPAKSKQY